MAGLTGEKKPMKVARATAGMAGGAGEFSYTRNSAMQAQSIDFLQPILEQEIEELELFKNEWSGSAVRVADFGCSVGANTLRYAEICSRSVCQAMWSKPGHEGRKFPGEVQYFLCDLPSNDFNTLFLQLQDWRTSQTSGENTFHAAAVPGSFHTRLFPKGSLHVAISIFSVQWLSQVPDLVLDKSSPAYNKGRVWIDGTTNSAALQAFAQAGRQDLRKFLLSRAEEVAPGGLVLLYSPGRADERHPEIQWPKEAEYAGPFSKVFEATWEELVTEGIIEAEKRDTFNIPTYFHSANELRLAVESTNAFYTKRLEIKQQGYFAPEEVEYLLTNPNAYGKFTKNFTRSLINSYIVEHIGEANSHEFFKCLEKNAVAAAWEKKVFSLPVDCVLAVLIRK